MDEKHRFWMVAGLAAFAGDFLVTGILGLFYPGYNHLVLVMSELGTVESPVALWVNGWWILFGLLIIGFAIGFRRAFASHGRAARVAALLIGLFGLGAGIGAGLFPMEPGGAETTLAGRLHGIFAGTGFMALAMVPLAGVVMCRRAQRPTLGWISGGVFVVGLVLFGLFVASEDAASASGLLAYAGLWQRLLLLTYYGYLGAFAATMIRSGDAHTAGENANWPSTASGASGRDNKRDVVIVLGLYVVWSLLLALGSWLLVSFPENEMPGGLTLGLTSLILGIIVPYHLMRTGVFTFRFLPPGGQWARVIGGLVLFGLFYLLVFPSGVLWQDTTVAFFRNPPTAVSAVSTFLSLLQATAVYGFIFWGGMLHVLRRAYGSIVAVLATSLLFSLYHLSQFLFTPPTLAFLMMTFVGGILFSTFTLWARCVLPTLIVHHLGHFFYFATLDDNPFAEDWDRFVATAVMLLLFFGAYWIVARRADRAGSRPHA